jgi:hypothetical protein
MWSDRYYYLNIIHDEQLSLDHDTKKLREFIKSLPELEQMGDYNFRNTKMFPFVEIFLLKANSIDSWIGNDTDSQKTNLISIVCAKGDKADFEKLKQTFIKIASFLNWQLIDECTDDGIENFILWKPEK